MCALLFSGSDWFFSCLLGLPWKGLRNELNALKLYMLLIAYRYAKVNFTAIGYEKICDISGIRRNDIPLARALLINFDLVRPEEGEPVKGQIGRPHTRYKIRGLGFEA